MYLRGNDDGLGFDPITAAFTVGSAVSVVKNLFGIGKKKGALAQIAANANGKWTGQLPPYADWTEYLSRPATNAKAKAGGAKTFLDEYNFWLKRKDSILIKNQIASPQDYAAWLIITYGMKDGWIKPSAKPGDPLYRTGPLAIETNIPIFDYEAITRWAEANMPKDTSAAPTGPRGVSPTSTPTAPAPVIAPPVFVPSSQPAQAPPVIPRTTAIPLTAPQQSFFPDAQFVAPQLTTQASAPPLTVTQGSITPLIAIGLAGALFLATRKKGR